MSVFASFGWHCQVLRSHILCWVGAPPSCTCFKRKDGTTDAENNVVPAWIGPDCSLRTCPFARAWVDIPFFNNTAHRNAECSNAGTCDRKSGNCVCYPGYEGRACDRST